MTVPRDALTAAEKALVRVVASDGLSVRYDVSDKPFIVKAPSQIKEQQR